MKVFILLFALTLTGCRSSDPTSQAKSLLETLEFGPDEYGEFQLTGQVDLNPLPLISTNVSINLRKIKDAPTQEPEVERE